MAVKIPVTGGGLRDKIQQVCGDLLLKVVRIEEKGGLLEKQAAFFVCICEEKK